MEPMNAWSLFRSLEPGFIENISTAMIVGVEGTVGIIGTRNDEVFSIGSGPLVPNVKCESSSAASIKPEKIVELCGKRLKGICSGAKSVLVLADNGELYTWGNNDNGQLGLGQDSDCADVPTRLNLPRSNNADPVVEIACGGSHSLALTTSGQIYSWGNNEYGQVCPRKLASEQHKIIWTPTDPLDEAGLGRSRIESIACGTASSLALRRDGQVWAWGQNHMSGFPQIMVSPKCIPLQVIVTKIACGEHNVLLLDNKGALHFWGDDGMAITREPAEVTGFTSVVTDILASWGSSLNVCQLESGDVYFWGHLLGRHWKYPELANFICPDAVFALDPSRPIMCRPLVTPCRTTGTAVSEFSKHDLESIYALLRHDHDQEFSGNMLLQLVVTAKRCNQLELLDDWKQLLMSCVTVENALNIFQVANQLNIPDLEMMALRAMAPPNFDRIVQSDLPAGLLVLIAQKLGRLGCFDYLKQVRN